MVVELPIKRGCGHPVNSSWWIDGTRANLSACPLSHVPGHRLSVCPYDTKADSGKQVFLLEAILLYEEDIL